MLMLDLATLLTVSNLAEVNRQLADHARTKCGTKVTVEMLDFLDSRLELREKLAKMLDAQDCMPIVASSVYRQGS